MATDSLSYSGINRAVSDFSGAKFCEELINLRPTSDGLVPVKPFTIKYANSSYYKIFVHHTTDGDKYIGVRKDATNYKVIVEVIGTPATLLFERTMTGSVSYEKTHKMNLYADNLSFAAAGNVILFSEYAADQYAPPFENVSFVWRDGGYHRTEADVPEIEFGFVYTGTDRIRVSQEIPAITVSSTEQDVLSAVQNALSAAQENTPELCMGTFIIAIAFKTKDGNTFWTGQWKVYDPYELMRYTSPPYEDATTLDQTIAAYYAPFFTKYNGYGYIVSELNSSGFGPPDEIKRLFFYGTKATVEFSGLSSTSTDPNYWNKNTSMIQSVEVYTSKPVPYLDVESAFDGFMGEYYGSGYRLYLLLAQRKYETMDLDGQLMYHQASIPMEDLAALSSNETYRLELTFGGNRQVTNDTLRVDAGAVTRYGKLLSYNSRFHYYGSLSRTKVGAPFFFYDENGGYASGSTYIIVRYSDSSTSRLMCVDTSSTVWADPARIVIAPSVNIKEVIVYSKIGGSYYWWKYRMKESKSYNYSICTEGGAYDSDSGTGTVAEYEAVLSSGNILDTEETAAINVTEQYNPFVFRVEHSYLAPGNVTDIVPQQYVVTDATYGREPLDVFTTQGVYALIQGNGEILYSWFDPISPMIAEGPAVPTEMGIFFISGGALWLCAGHRTTLVSDALSVGPHKYIRACAGYKKISGQDSSYSPSPVISSPAYDVSSNLSQVEFETFASGNSAQSIGRGRLSYNRFRQEVYVSNGDYQYSYVLSLKYRQWFKVPYYIMQDEQASVLAKIPSPTESGNDYVDLSAESSTTHVTFHMQSRPFSMGYQYIHMHRLISQMRASLATGDLVVVGLYGSNDLQEWKLLAYSKRAGASTPLKVSQIRTTSSARSWRYYTICIGGTVYAGAVDNTDIGPFLVDYEPVVRRIG